ncbi:unnamed protein product (macronuclear) [Paramecium tetraurelia]|uniref:Uncharacterized protein n=1 Tax=Paramecium tetraurelia TaxID=5888 RepID=A0C2N6_PARTE|nr:uncharacterized protein GSPATT00034531001 [Paramecium tetraurelia]CAK65053.1 unnamed protein product [Paramecium tetraurelia]|eukprot:XP_001432450.1 hypothetical protein (macronuclear) [Paramecium tetraurelia strain d4-2]
MTQNDSEATKLTNDILTGSKKINKKQGHWNEAEHKAYLSFLEENNNHTKGQRLFKKMSQVVGTRTPSQCRSHHQKFNPQKPHCHSETGILRSKQYARKYFAKQRTLEHDSN